LERTIAPEERSGASHAISVSGSSIETDKGAIAQTDASAVVHTTSSAEYIVSQIKSHKKDGALIAAAVVMAVVRPYSFT